ncbi:MAG: histone deacetylase [Patescibacteria group bacterium]
MKIVYSKKFTELSDPDRPESAERILVIYQALKNLPKIKFIEPKPASEKDLLIAHTKAQIQTVKNNRFFDPDTPNLENIYPYAVLSAGSAITASEIALRGEPAFSLARPPGHHAGKNSIAGFCYFNNLAIASLKLAQKRNKASILDLDAHHGNGTQEIVLDQPNILFCSIHQSPLYPGTGLKSIKNCYNFPITPGSDFYIYKQKLEKALDLTIKFKPKIIAVSLGFDTYKADPLADLNLDLKNYFEIGKMLASLNLPMFFVLEGGYSNKIGEGAKNFFKGFLDIA